MAKHAPKVGPTLAMAEFLAKVSPGVEREVHDLFIHAATPQGIARPSDAKPTLRVPELQLYCSSDKCDGIRQFTGSTGSIVIDDDRARWTTSGTWYSPQGRGPKTFRPAGIGQGESHTLLAFYRCRNCGESTKLFALTVTRPSEWLSGRACKLGEDPVFGPVVPRRLEQLLGHDHTFFLKGLRNEALGLGIGAAAYYRRVVQNQAEHLLDQMGAAAEKPKSATAP